MEPDPTWSDAELVRAYQDGIKAAWDVLYLRYQPNLHYFFFYKGIRNPENIDDLVQETLFAAMRNIDQIKNPERFKGWLYRIATGTMSRWLTKEDKRREVQKSLDIVNNLVTTEELCTPTYQEPEDAAIDKEYMEIVFSLIAQLPPSEKEALRLHYDGMKNTEIAKKLGIKASTVNVRIYKARQKLKNWLEDEYPEIYADLVSKGII